MKKIIIIIILFNCYSVKAQISPIIDTPTFVKSLLNIRERDQSNMDNPKIRVQLFLNNFDSVYHLINKYGFPPFQELSDDRMLRIKMELGIPMTLIHVCQANRIDLILDERFIQLIKRELNSKRLEKERLTQYLSFWYNGHYPPCEAEKNKVEYALKEWELTNFKSIPYKNCDH